VIIDREGTPTGLELELTRVAGGGADALQLSLIRHTPDGVTTEGIAWADPGSEHIGLDLGWFKAGLATADRAPAPKPDLDLLLSWMAGSFSSAAQAAADPNFSDIRLHMTPIWTWRDDARWLYVEQAAASSLEKPYRQRIYRVAEVADGLFESQVLELDDTSRFAGAWQAPDRFDSLNPAMLTPRSGCAILMRRAGDTFVGSTLGSLCVSSLRGASFATSQVTITASGLTSWDRGWAADGSQVWGAVTAGYRFDRVDAEP
jgi:CpeT protein